MLIVCKMEDLSEPHRVSENVINGKNRYLSIYYVKYSITVFRGRSFQTGSEAVAETGSRHSKH